MPNHLMPEFVTTEDLRSLRAYAELVGDIETATKATVALTVYRDMGKKQRAAKEACCQIINGARERGTV